MAEPTPLGLARKDKETDPTGKELVSEVARGWLAEYVDYASGLTDSPVIFHLAVGLSQLATACGSRIVFNGAGGKTYWPNLYILFIAPSGISRKTTSINMGIDLLKMANPECVSPNETSREEFLRLLANHPEMLIKESEFASALSRYNRDYMCVDEETECLTEEGWKSINNLAKGDKLIGLRERGPTTYLESAPVIAVHRYGVSHEEMVSVEARSLSMLLTTNHKVRLATQRHMIRADDLRAGQSILQVARWGVGAGAYGQSGTGTEKMRARARAAVLGWYLTEGWSEGPSVRLAQKNKCEQLIADLNTSGWEWNEQKPKANGVRLFRLHPKGSAVIMEWAPNKQPCWAILRTWSRAALQRLWDTLLLGDGHVQKRRGAIEFTQNPGPIRDFFQALSLRLGYRTVFKGGVVGSITRNRRCTLSKDSKPSRELYTGQVWCPESELGTFVARRHGTVFITGNSGMKELVTDLYDNVMEYRRQIKGKEGTGEKLIIRKPALNYLAASTLEWLIDSLTVNDMRSGFLARFLIFPALGKGGWVSFLAQADEQSRDALAAMLVDLCRLPAAKVDFQPVRKQFNAWAKQMESLAESAPPEVVGFYSRVVMHCAKLCTLLTISDHGARSAYSIDEEVFGRASHLMEWLRDRYEELADRKLVFSKEERQMQAIMDAVRKDGKIEWSSALKLSHLKTQDFQRYLSTLIDRKEATVVTEQTKTKPAKMICLPNQNGKVEMRLTDLSRQAAGLIEKP